MVGPHARRPAARNRPAAALAGCVVHQASGQLAGPGAGRAPAFRSPAGAHAGAGLVRHAAPGPLTCGGYLGSWQHEQQDAQTWADWGIDYLKYDWCSYGNVINGLPDNDPMKVSSLSYNGGNELNTAMKPFKMMGDYLKEQPRDIVFSVCQYGMSDVWKWGGTP